MVNFSSFVSNEVKSEHINQLLAYLHLNEREEIREMINKLSKYEKDINLFNKEFYVALRNSLFEYSLVSATFVERNDRTFPSRRRPPYVLYSLASTAPGMLHK